MKKIIYLTSLLLLGFALASCEKVEEPIKYVDATFVFNAPDMVNCIDVKFGIQSLQLKEINTGEVFDVFQTVTKAGEPEMQYKATVKTKIPEGLYTIDMKALAVYKTISGVQNTPLTAFKENIEITELTAAQPFEFETFLNVPVTNFGFVLAEIFFTGSETPEHKQYSGDAYFRIYNNSDQELCANGLTIAESEFMTIKKQEYTPDIMNEAFAVDAVYRIPVDGEKIMVKPGESLLLVDQAINHTKANKNSFDLTKADFEWYDENDRYPDSDNPNVPNLEKLYASSLSVWTPHNRGFKSFVLARLGDSEDNQLSMEEYVENYKYDYSYNFVYPGGTIPMKGTAYKIPNKWIIDAVNLSVEAEYQWIVTAPNLDRGWSFCGKVDRDKTRYGKSVRRKVFMDKTLQDTNNSTEDFLPEQIADPYFQFHK